jgi:hypothetical protein
LSTDDIAFVTSLLAVRAAFGEGLPCFEACHGLFEQVEATLDQFVFGFQALDARREVTRLCGT